jgi:putative DNA primase/helicase
VNEIVATESLLVVTASDIRPELIEWLWDGRIPFGKLTLFSGNPDLGKSLVTLDIAGRATTGRDWPDGEKAAPPCDVLILTAEDDPSDTIVPRLMACEADLRKVHFLTSTIFRNGKRGQAARDFALDTDVQLLNQHLLRYPETRLVIIDPISNYLGGASINKEQEVRRVLSPLAKVMADTGCAGITVGHFNKSLGVSAIHKTGGAVALVGVQRIAWGFMRPPDEADLTLMLRVKGNLSKSKGGLRYRIKTRQVSISGQSVEQPIIGWDGCTDETADGTLSVESDPGEGKIRSAMRWVKTALAEGRRRSRDIYEEADAQGFIASTVKTASQRIGVSKVNECGEWYWDLPIQVSVLPVLPVGYSSSSTH